MSTEIPQTDGGTREEEAFVVYCGNVDREGTARIVRATADLSSRGVSSLHLLFQSTGGYVSYGIFLYNYFRSMPLDLTIYNEGAVRSAGVVAFLGARRRVANENATFLVHPCSMNSSLASVAKLDAILRGLRVDQERMEAILRQHLTLSRTQWRCASRDELTLTAKQALQAGLVDELCGFAPPRGTSPQSIS